MNVKFLGEGNASMFFHTIRVRFIAFSEMQFYWTISYFNVLQYMNRIFKKTKYKLSNINQIVHVSIYCMSVQKNKKYTLREM